MLNRKLVSLATLVAVAGIPGAALAQTVTTSPFAEAAPALGTLMLAVLVGCLLVAAVYSLRHTDLRAGGAAALALALTLAAGVGYSVPPSSDVVVSGPECFEVTTHAYSAIYNPELTNECPNPIQIDAFDLPNGTDIICLPPEVAADVVEIPECQIDTVLQPGEACSLPDGCSG